MLLKKRKNIEDTICQKLSGANGQSAAKKRRQIMNILDKRLKEKFPEEQLAVILYTNMKSEATVKCLHCGTEYTLKRAENFLTKSKRCVCSKCNNNFSGKRYDKNTIQEKVKELFPNENLIVLNYTGMKNPCQIQCQQCGQIYDYVRADNALKKIKQSVCKNCRPNKIEFIETKRAEFLDFMKHSQEFDLLNSDLSKVFADDYVAATCLRCGKINFKTMYDYLRGRGCSCQCHNTLKSLEQINQEIDSDYEILEYAGMEHSAKVRHKVCGFIYDKSPRHYACPKCNKVKSKGEQEVKRVLTELGIDYLQEQSVNIENHNLRFDFYLPQFQTFIEFQGVQHFEPVSYFGGEERFKIQQQYDQLKRQFCEKNNFHLIEISYQDLEDNKIFNLLKFNDYLVIE